MQKQYSESNSSHGHPSLSSRSARKLYHRIHNNNIRVINKSKISSKSNHSIGSVALRRTQLSNDKIYSREEDMMHANSSQAGVDFDSAIDTQGGQQSVPMAPLMSNRNYRPRVLDSPSQRSLRSDSQKSSKYRPNPRKYNKNQIEKLFMLEANDHLSNGTQNKGRQNKRHQRSNSRKPKQSIPSPRPEDRQFYNQADNKIKSVRTIKSSNKSNIKPNPSKQQPKYAMSPQQSNEIQKLARKYKKMANEQALKSSRDQDTYNYIIEQMYIGQPKQREVRNDWYEEVKPSSRNLQKYQSQKYLPPNDSEVYSRKSGKKRTYIQQRGTKDEKPNNNSQQYIEQRQRNNQANYKRQKLYENSLQKYQKDTWARTTSRKQVQGERQYPSRKDYINAEGRKAYDKRSKHYKHEEGDIYRMRGKEERSELHNIRIKEEQYGNLYGSCEDERTPNKRHSRSRNYVSPAYNSPRHKQRPHPDHEYYHHIHASSKKHNPHLNTPETQISSTFDSLMLSINSHITSGIGQSTNLKSVIDKINLHLGTLDLISDYAQEFKKMYEQIEDWEELIFLAYKKFWIERTKVLEYLKKFKKAKRHESQRMQSNGSRKVIENKLSSIKNIGSQIPRHSKVEDPFSDGKAIKNPFIIPFSKVNQDEARKIAQSEEGTLLIQRLQKQTSQIYQKLQQMYNMVISKSGSRINMVYCDNFCGEIFIKMLDQIEQLIPNLEQAKLFEVTKIRLGKIVKSGILMLFLNGKVIRNMAEIITFDDCQKIGNKKKIKTFTTYDLYYEVFEKMVAE